VGKLRKHQHEGLSAEAARLVLKWKKAVAQEAQRPSGGQHGGQAEENMNTSSNGETARAAADGGGRGTEMDNGSEEDEQKTHSWSAVSPPTSPEPAWKNGSGSPATTATAAATTGGTAVMMPTKAKRPVLFPSDQPRQSAFEMLVEALAPSGQALPGNQR